MVDRGERRGGGACLETGGQLMSKHEAVQLVGAVGHEVAFVTYPTAWQAQGRQANEQYAELTIEDMPSVCHNI